MLLITAAMTFYELRMLKFLSVVKIKVITFIFVTSIQVCVFKPGSNPAQSLAFAQCCFPTIISAAADLQFKPK